MSEEYTTWIEHKDGTMEPTVKGSAERCVKNAKAVTESIGAATGLAKRVFIVDSGDCIVFQWEHGKGITFPEGLAVTARKLKKCVYCGQPTYDDFCSEDCAAGWAIK